MTILFSPVSRLYRAWVKTRLRRSSSERAIVSKRLGFAAEVRAYQGDVLAAHRVECCQPRSVPFPREVRRSAS